MHNLVIGSICTIRTISADIRRGVHRSRGQNVASASFPVQRMSGCSGRQEVYATVIHNSRNQCKPLYLQRWSTSLFAMFPQCEISRNMCDMSDSHFDGRALHNAGQEVLARRRELLPMLCLLQEFARQEVQSGRWQSLLWIQRLCREWWYSFTE